jgi:hypothetical protein
MEFDNSVTVRKPGQVTAMLSSFKPLLGHVAGVPVEETLPGVLAMGFVDVRLATDWLRRRLRWRPRDTVVGKGSAK